MAKSSSYNKVALSVLLGLVIVAVFASGIWWISQSNERTEAVNSFEQCKEAGGRIAESYPEQCMHDGESIINPDQEISEPPVSEPTQNDIDAAQLYVGLTEDEAYARADSEGKVARVVSIDGEDQMVTMDFRLGRLNLHIVDGVVDRVDVEGA